MEQKLTQMSSESPSWVQVTSPTATANAAGAAQGLRPDFSAVLTLQRDRPVPEAQAASGPNTQPPPPAEDEREKWRQSGWVDRTPWAQYNNNWSGWNSGWSGEPPWQNTRGPPWAYVDPPPFRGWPEAREWKDELRRWRDSTQLPPSLWWDKIMRTFGDLRERQKFQYIPKDSRFSAECVEAIAAVVQAEIGEHEFSVGSCLRVPWAACQRTDKQLAPLCGRSSLGEGYR